MTEATTEASPTGLHAPVTNQTTAEAAPPAEERAQDPSAGTEEGEVEAMGPREETGGAESALESVAAAPEPVAPDTSALGDIGAASYTRPAAVLETVHGVDNRVRITDTAKYPYRAIASLLITARDGSQWVGTGWFISPRTLITAGHCVYIKNSGMASRDGWVKSMQVLPGRDGTTLPYGSVTSSQFWTVKGWADNGDENYDYAAIILPVDVGTRVGTLGYGVFSDSTLLNSSSICNVTGYPGDKSGAETGTLWTDSKRIASVNASKVFYDIDTFGGQSGCPAYIIRNGMRYAVAVHAYGGPTTNSGTRISAPVFQNLNNWRA